LSERASKIVTACRRSIRPLKGLSIHFDYTKFVWGFYAPHGIKFPGHADLVDVYNNNHRASQAQGWRNNFLGKYIESRPDTPLTWVFLCKDGTEEHPHGVQEELQSLHDRATNAYKQHKRKLATQ
ncbi:hypothetical protein CC2G_009790, partial [Coprinopsis cinerea AmutBmut pab1-1]